MLPTHLEGRQRNLKHSARNAHATFDVAAVGKVIKAGGLRAAVKAGDHPPEPDVGAQVLDPIATVDNRLIAAIDSMGLRRGLRHQRQRVPKVDRPLDHDEVTA